MILKPQLKIGLSVADVKPCSFRFREGRERGGWGNLRQEPTGFAFPASLATEAIPCIISPSIRRQLASMDRLSGSDLARPFLALSVMTLMFLPTPLGAQN